MSSIRSIHGRQVLDSRGRPTVEVEVRLSSGVTGRASVPSGASTGAHEAHELRDGDPAFFNGLGVTAAVAHVNGEIAVALADRDAMDQGGCDRLLRDLDGTGALSRLGANAVLGTSLAICRASAAHAGEPLFWRIADLAGVTDVMLPVPMVNILSGGLHAGRGMDVQDFLVMPIGADTMQEALRLASRVRDAAAVVCADRGVPTLLADEGGLSPGCRTGHEALELLMTAIEHAGLEPGRDIAIAIDVAAASLYDKAAGTYRLRREGRAVTRDEMIDMIISWIGEFPVLSVEDPLDEEDWAGWSELTSRVGGRAHLIGDDLFATNAERLRKGITSGAATGVLVKANQNGTLTGTLQVVAVAREAGYVPIVSARSGETEDDLLADLAVGTAAGQIKVGSLRSSERLAKYNQLLRIAETPGIRLSGYPAPDRAPARGLSA
jgi:enolase